MFKKPLLERIRVFFWSLSRKNSHLNFSDIIFLLSCYLRFLSRPFFLRLF